MYFFFYEIFMKDYAKLRNTFCYFACLFFTHTMQLFWSPFAFTVWTKNILQNVFAALKKEWIRMMSERKL